MPYNPNYNPDNNQGIGNKLGDLAYRQARINDNSNDKTGRDAAAAAGDVLSGAGQVFFGDNNAPGLIGGARQVNPNAYWGISGDPYRQNAVDAQGRPLMQGQGDQTRLQQQQLIQMLMDQAQGRGPSVAQNQLQQATDRNIAANASMAASGRGPGAAAGAYNAMNATAATNQQAASDSAMLRMQEQLQARAMLGQATGQVRQQDLGQQQLMFQEQAQQDDMVQKYLQMGYTADQANRQAALDMEKLKTEAYKGGSGGGGFLGGLFSAMSDERLKEDVKDADDELAAFLDTLEPHSYKYKDEKHGKGRRVSVMAQELEKSKLGSEFVFETEDGKGVDYGKGLGTMLATQAALHRRLKKLEAKRG